MDKYSLELATSILHLEMQKDKILKDNEKKKRLCACRSRILHNYINVCQLFFIRFTSRIIKFQEDNNIEKTITTQDLESWYLFEMYDKLFYKHCLSTKMIILFKLLQSKTDEVFFNEFDKKFRNLLNFYSDQDQIHFRDGLTEIYQDILDWMETHILGIISLSIDCSNINDELIDNYKGDFSERIQKCNHGDGCSTCPFLVEECPTKEIFGDKEEIHLYVTEEMLKDKEWMILYFEMIEKYHDDPKHIDITLDYIFFDSDCPLEFQEEYFSYFKMIKEKFRSFNIINFDSVDFGKYKKEVMNILEK